MRIEDGIQMAVVEYLKVKYRKVKFTISPIVKLSPQMGAKMKRMGYSPGTPDIMILAPVNPYFGLFLELKTEKGHQSPAQKEWQAYLNDRGYCYALCKGVDEAINVIDKYMNIK